MSNKDTIYRQAALDALNNIKIPRNASWYQYYCKALTAMNGLPPAQPMSDKDTIYRQTALDALNNIKIPRNASWYQYYCEALTAMNGLPPA